MHENDANLFINIVVFFQPALQTHLVSDTIASHYDFHSDVYNVQL